MVAGNNYFNKANASLTFLDDALEKLIGEVVHASNRGVSAVRNASGEPNWSFGQSLFFSSTVVTTIGKITSFIFNYEKGISRMKHDFDG